MKLRVRNGYQKSEKLLAANAAPKEVRVELLRGGAVVASTTATLKRRMGWREVLIPMPEGAGLDEVALEVLSVHPGSAYTDTCISDVEIFVDSDVTYNGPAELVKQQAARAWIAERVQVAAYFASKPPEYPFAATSFTESKAVDLPPEEAEALLAPFIEELGALSQAPVWYSAAVAKPIREPDRFPRDFQPALQLFAPSGVAFFQAKEEVGRHRRLRERIHWYGDEWRSNHHVEWAEAEGGPVRRVHFWWKRVVEERGTSESRTEFLAVYDDQQRLAKLLALGTTTGEPDEYGFEILYTFHHDAQGRIERAEALSCRHVLHTYMPEGSDRVEKSAYR